MDKDAKETRNRRIFDLWLACWTQQEITDDVGMTAKGVSEIIEVAAELPKLQKPQKAAAEHATDFDPPIYNIWTQQISGRSKKHLCLFAAGTHPARRPV